MTTSDLVHRLSGEHAASLNILEKMKTTSAQLKFRGYEPALFKELWSAVLFINSKIHKHSLIEEQALLPVLEERIGENGPGAFMRAEHRQLWSTVDRLEMELKSLPATPSDVEKIQRVVELSQLIFDLLRSHIEKENSILFPLTRDKLGEEDLNRIQRFIEEITETVG